MNELTVSFGSGEPRPNNAQFAYITRVARMSWADVVAMFKAPPPVSEDKSSAGWYSFAEFDPVYRDSENFVARYALTMDFDHITREDLVTIQKAWSDREYVMYTTASHTPDKPRVRVILPLSRPAGYDEFQAVSRRVAEEVGIELASRETHVPAQMMYLPTVKPGAKYKVQHHAGEWVDVDAVLASYTDWTDRSQWPHRADADSAGSGEQVSPLEKEGIVGQFCRAFSIEEAIARFGLPYERVR